MPFFSYQGQRIHYTEFASDVKPPAETARSAAARRGARSNGSLKAAKGRPLILLHGLMLSQEMHRPLAEELARRGNRVITMDLLGHGRSDRPRDMWRYSMAIYGEQIVGLMDHLELEQAAVMGTSLGANAALEVASQHPERLRGMVIEMPVLDNGLLASALAFTPLLVALTFGEPVMKRVASVTRAVPRGLLPHWGNVMLDVIRQEPGPGRSASAGTVLRPRGAAAQRAADLRGADARARPPARPGAPLLRRRDARRGDAQRAPDRSQLAGRAAAAAGAPDRRDRRLPGRALGPPAEPNGPPAAARAAKAARSGIAPAHAEHDPRPEPARDARQTGPDLAPLSGRGRGPSGPRTRR